jgi:hypothetical protein
MPTQDLAASDKPETATCPSRIHRTAKKEKTAQARAVLIKSDKVQSP